MFVDARDRSPLGLTGHFGVPRVATPKETRRVEITKTEWSPPSTSEHEPRSGDDSSAILTLVRTYGATWAEPNMPLMMPVLGLAKTVTSSFSLSTLATFKLMGTS